MTYLSYDQRQAAHARGRGLQAEAIRQAFATLYHLPARLVEAFGHRGARSAGSQKGHHAA